jgi:hypothetical protein
MITVASFQAVLIRSRAEQNGYARLNAFAEAKYHSQSIEGRKEGRKERRKERKTKGIVVMIKPISTQRCDARVAEE